jgi:hypothetical protein
MNQFKPDFGWLWVLVLALVVFSFVGFMAWRSIRFHDACRAAGGVPLRMVCLSPDVVIRP